MLLGGPLFGDCSTPEAWIPALRRHGYRAAYCPVDENADDATVRAFERTANENGIVIAEVGAWSNPLSADERVAADAVRLCRARLDLADRIGARCCVNIAGSRGEQWDGPDVRNFTDETFDMIVESVRSIIDAVRPTRTFYTLETMPWIFPDSADSYLRLIHAIDRERFAVHLDPANLICGPQRYFNNGDLIRDCFAKLGGMIRSCHAKDVRLEGRMTVHIEEVAPGQGALEYPTFLNELSRLDPDTPLMLEHLQNEPEYAAAGAHIRSIATEVGAPL